MNNFGILLLSAACWPFVVMPAAAQCVTADPAVVPDIQIDPLDANGATQIMQPATLRFRRVGIDTAPLTVTFQIVDEDSPLQVRVGMNGGPRIEWRSTDSSREIGAVRQDAFGLLRSGRVSFAAGETSKNVDIRLFLSNLREDLPAGVYREQYSVRYWCGEADASVPTDMPGVLSVAIRVPNVLSANIGGASSNGEIDFLDFSSPSRSLSISVRSTGRYTISAHSLNGRVLLREGATKSSELDRLPYEIRFGGRALTPEAGAAFTNSRAGRQGIQMPLDVMVGDVSGKRAGRYADTLTLTLTPAN